jgi:hypothetical protein
MTAPDWDKLPRMLGEYCDGPHGGMGFAVYAFDSPAGHRSWYCQSCWLAVSRARERPTEAAP